MLDFRAQSVIMEKQFHNRQFGTILSLNKTTETTSMKTMVFIEGAVPRYARTKPGRKKLLLCRNFFRSCIKNQAHILIFDENLQVCKFSV